MKVILLKDIPKIGKKNDIKDLSDGFAQNMLINKGLAVRASSQEVAKLQHQVEQEENRILKDKIEFSEMAKNLMKADIVLYANANDKGSLFKSVSKKDIQKAILDSTNYKVKEELIFDDHKIKSIGTHQVGLKFKDKMFYFTLEVNKK